GRLWRVCSLKRFLSIPLVLGVVFADVRDGFFVGGRLGLTNVSPSYEAPQHNASNPSDTQAFALQQQLNADIDKLVANLNNIAIKAIENALKNNKETYRAQNNQVSTTGDVNNLDPLSTPLLNGLESQDNTLEQTIAQKIGALDAMIANKQIPDTPEIQQASTEYANILKALQEGSKNLIHEINEAIDAYNKALDEAKAAYKSALEKHQQTAQENTQYQQKERAYDQQKQQYNKASGVVNDYNQTLDHLIQNIREYVPQYNDQGNQISKPPSWQAFLNNLKSISGNLDAINAMISANREILTMPWNPQEFSQYQQDGYHEAQGSACRVDQSAAQAAGGWWQYFINCIQNMVPKLDQGILPTNPYQLIEIQSWFYQKAVLISDLKKIGGYSENTIQNAEEGLINAYQSYLNALSTSSFPTPGQAHNPYPTPTPPGKPPPPISPLPNPKFSYKFNFAKIASLNVPQFATRPNLSGMVHAFSNTFYHDMDINGSLVASYQHFFSQHLGFSLDAFLGYGYIRSPVYSSLSFFKHLQDIQIDVGGNLIYDFNVPKNYQSPLFYGMFAGVQGGSTNFVLGAGDKSLWRASYNLDVDLGFRFQFSTNIIKWGVDIPLIPHELNWQVDSTHLQLDQNAKDIGIFMTYEKLIF
ncbi:hypothetical protein, partial [Helicobacter ailurogastricus]|uniref:hypothetical protein n=1 Tax=Helicobacter ailurogastricus TaxID=1578720 RepID=UPI0025563434